MTRNPIAKNVTRIRPQVKPGKRKPPPDIELPDADDTGEGNESPVSTRESGQQG